MSRRGKTWPAPGDTAWVEFDAGTYKCELVSRNEYGYWTVKWANGDEDNKTVWEQNLEREAPQKRAKISVVCFVCHALGREAPCQMNMLQRSFPDRRSR